MSTVYLLGFITMSSVGLLCLLLGAFISTEKFGYFVMTKEDENIYRKRELCRYVGRLLIIISFCLFTILLGIYSSITRLVFCGIISIPVITVIATLLVRQGNRFLS